MAKKNIRQLAFDDQLILYKYFLSQFDLEALYSLSKILNNSDYEEYDENQNTYFFDYLEHLCHINNKITVNKDRLRIYDENICRHVKRIGKKRDGIKLKYFQYISLLFTEMYLDRYFGDRTAFIKDLNDFLKEKQIEAQGKLEISEFTEEKMNKLAFMCATGSGKTLIMHINILQYMHYFKRAQRTDNRLSLNKIIVLAPNEAMSNQHLEELKLSSISAAKFDKEMTYSINHEDVIVIDMNKLKEEGKIKTVSIDSFEKNNLVLVDEGHRGLSGDVWYDYRNRLSAEGFSFEYSATFKQALSANTTKKEEKILIDEYGKSIIMDYSYKYFYSDGYGKDYRIYNLRNSIDDEQRYLYLTGCLLSFYQQIKLYTENINQLKPFRIEKPLLVFVGNRVTVSVSASELTDVEEVVDFIDKFVRNKSTTISRINSVLNDSTGLVDGNNNELFFQDFTALKELFKNNLDGNAIYEDIMHLVFNTDTISDEPRLHIEDLHRIDGEIGLKIGEYGSYFGVINIGDTSRLIKNCLKKGIVVKTEEFFTESLFQNINKKESNINILIGSRKFTEGWNSWRVSTMGLINFAKGEGSQAIQLFGRGVRLKGYNGCLKRSSKLDFNIDIPKNIEILERLTVFGIKAQYMEDFMKYLEIEGAPLNSKIYKYNIQVKNRFDKIKDKNLHIIKLKDGTNFKKQAKRLLLDMPSEQFLRYLIKNKIIIDCRSKVQTIDSTFSFNLQSNPEENKLDDINIKVLDYDRIFEELEIYKNEKMYYNIIINKQMLSNILRVDGWYSLIIPKSHLTLDSIEKIQTVTDYAIILLKAYIDKFYKFEKKRWEAPNIEYGELTEYHNNFINGFLITYTQTIGNDKNYKELEDFVEEINNNIEIKSELDKYEKTAFKNNLMAIDASFHLYTPLIYSKNSNLKITVSPVNLNESEKIFIDKLKIYIEADKNILKDKDIYLLRNKSKMGMGFFEADNFYPDFILWIITEDTEYITFIDPKGLMHVHPNDPKIEFYKRIKELENNLAGTIKDRNIILNSFIMSGTPSVQLRERWHMSRAERETKNVYCLDCDDCIDLMINKILS